MNRKIKICYIITSMEGGGAGFSIPAVVDLFKRNDFDVTVVSCQSRDMGTARLLEEYNIPYVVLGGEKRSVIKEIFSVIRFNLKFKADVIMTSLSRASIIGQVTGKILGIPVVSWKNSADLKTSSRVGKSIPKLWIADSKSVSDFIVSKMDIEPSKICIWPPFVADDSYPSSHSWDAQRPLHIGSTGRLHAVKNYDLLLAGLAEFCKDYPEYKERVRLSIAGNGPMKDELSALIARYDLQRLVTLRDFIRDIPSFLSELDVYVQPSKFEGFCIAAHEAMNASLLMIVSPVGELPYSVTDGEQGFVVKDNIPKGISNILRDIFKNPDLVKRCGEASRRYIMENYSKSLYEDRGMDVVNKIKSLVKRR